MIDRERVNSGFELGEILHEERSHIRVNLIAIRNRQIGTGATSCFPTLLTTLGLGELAQDKTVSNIPNNARELASTISYAGHKV